MGTIQERVLLAILHKLDIYVRYFYTIFNFHFLAGEEWGKKRKGKGRRRKKKFSDSEEASMSSSDSDGPKKKRGKQVNTGYTKPVKISEDLEAIIGVKEAPRHEVIKLMWAYIKENKLQDPKNKQFAICDDKLEKVIGEKKFKCFGMAKYLKEHMS